MDTDHSKYYNDDVQAIVKKYNFKSKGIFSIYLFISAIYVISMIPIAIYMSSSTFFCLFLLWFLFRTVCMYIYRSQFLHIMKIFYLDCDAEKLYEVLSLLEARNKRKNNANTFLLYKAHACCYIPGRNEEGLSLIKQVHFKKKTAANEQSLLFVSSHYAKMTHDKAWFAQIKNDMKNLKGGSTRQKERFLQLIRLTELTWDIPMTIPVKLPSEIPSEFSSDIPLAQGGLAAGSIDTPDTDNTPSSRQEVRELLSTLLSAKNRTLHTVTFRTYLAKLDIAEGEYQSAKEHLEYIASHGGTLYLAAQAEELLASL